MEEINIHRKELECVLQESGIAGKNQHLYARNEDLYASNQVLQEE
jgi:hypothetical protein